MPYKLTIILLLFVLSSYSDSNSGIDVTITISEELKSDFDENGRMFLFLTQNPQLEPRTQTWPNPFAPTHIFAKNLTGIDPESPVQLNDFTDWIGTPEWTFNEIPDGEYYAQVLWDQDTLESRIDAPGNIYSTKHKITIGSTEHLEFTLDQVIPDRAVKDHDLARFIEFTSDTLSKWWDKPMTLKAAVLLPDGYKKGAEYAIRYNVSGYGGRYTRINRLLENQDFMNWWTSGDAPEVINVFLDGEGPFGDSYQMDSDNSGPYGYALINELIPYIESEYRGSDDMETRFVDGCSTGGWVSLGLQLYYPDTFGAVFSYSPDAMEFENYQLINIYKDENAFVNEFGYERPVMRDISGEPLLSLRRFIQYENVLGSSDSYLNSGGQFSAHTALYSPKGENGLPEPLFDSKTGEINHSVAEYWKKYDFKLYVMENWDEIGPKLDDKIYIWAGDMDQFYLNVATRTFADFLSSAKDPVSDAVIEFAPMQVHCQQFSNKRVLEQIQDKLK